MRMRTLPVTIGAGIGLVTCWAPLSSANNKHTAAAITCLFNTTPLLTVAHRVANGSEVDIPIRAEALARRFERCLARPSAFNNSTASHRTTELDQSKCCGEGVRARRRN